MEIGVSTASLFGRAKTEDALKILQEIDARVVEIFLGSFYEYENDFAYLLKQNLGNLKVHSVHTLNTHFEPQLFRRANQRAFSDSLEIFEKVLRSAQILNANNYTMHGNMRFKKGSKFEKYEEYGEYFNLLIEICEKYNVNLCLENVEWAFYGKVGFFSKVKNFSPKLKSCFDIKQARISGYNWQDYVSEMGDSLQTVHLSDVDKNGKVCLPGTGEINFYEVFSKLKEVGFKGNGFIEVYQESFDNISQLENSLKFLRKIKSEVFGND